MKEIKTEHYKKAQSGVPDGTNRPGSLFPTEGDPDLSQSNLPKNDQEGVDLQAEELRKQDQINQKKLLEKKKWMNREKTKRHVNQQNIFGDMGKGQDDSDEYWSDRFDRKFSLGDYKRKPRPEDWTPPSKEETEKKNWINRRKMDYSAEGHTWATTPWPNYWNTIYDNLTPEERETMSKTPPSEWKDYIRRGNVIGYENERNKVPGAERKTGNEHYNWGE
jgi:hypothetical protein